MSTTPREATGPMRPVRVVDHVKIAGMPSLSARRLPKMGKPSTRGGLLFVVGEPAVAAKPGRWIMGVHSDAPTVREA